MYHFLIEFLELAVSCLGLGEGGCDCDWWNWTELWRHSDGSRPLCSSI